MNEEFDDTSRALMEAAHEILESHGPEGLTVRRIAAQAGMSTMNVYSRFDGKHGVINQLYAEGFNKLAARLAAVEVTTDACRDIKALLAAYRDFSIEYRSYYRVMFGSSTVPNFEPSEDAIGVAYTSLMTVATRVEKGFQDGDFRPIGDWNAEQTAAWLWAVVHGVVSLEVYSVGSEWIEWEALFDLGIESAIEGVVGGVLRPTNT